MIRSLIQNDIPRVAIFVDAAHAYGRSLLAGVSSYVEQASAWSLFTESHSLGSFDLKWLRNRKPDGILAFVENLKDAQCLSRLEIPVVEVSAYLRGVGLPQIGNDERAVGRLAAEHLLERQFCNYAYCGYRQQSWSERRCDGFTEFLAEAGHGCKIVRLQRSYDGFCEWEKKQNDLAEWIAGLPKPVGIMACSDRCAQGVLDACFRANILVPEEVAIIGVDNDEIMCRMSTPQLSSVIDNAKQIGFEAAHMIDLLMSGEAEMSDFDEPRLVPPIDVARRQSTDITTVDDQLTAQSLALIQLHACRGLTVNDILDKLAVSRTVLYEHFRDYLGRTPHEQITIVRLYRVRELLLQTDWNLQKIADAAGFDSPDYLGRVFRKYFNTTPGAYRSSIDGLIQIETPTPLVGAENCAF